MVRPARLSFTAFVLALIALPALAQPRTGVQASVDRSTIPENESFTYVLRTEGSVQASPDTQSLEHDFEILSRRSSQRIQYINGRARQVDQWVYELMPKKAGEFRLPRIRVGGALSNFVDVHIVPAQTSSSAPGDIFMEVGAEPKKAYVQSQVLFTLRLYVGVSTGRATLSEPKITGGEAIVQRLGEDHQYQATRDGRHFIVRERRYAVFPQKAGKLTIGPATFEAMVIPDHGFSRIRRLRSGSVQIDVKPPVPPPAAYSQAAWLPARKVTIAERWSDDDKQFTLGVPRTRTLTVKADGLLETQLPKLPLASSGGIKEYPDQPELDHDVTDDGIEGRRTERYAVIAQRAGKVTMAGVELPWFDTQTGKWEVARLAPREETVLPGDALASEPALAVDTGTAAAPQSVPPAASWWPWLSLGLGCGWLATLALWLRGGFGRGPARVQPQPKPRRASNRRLVGRLRAACERNDAAGAQRLLLEWGALEFPDDPPHSLGTLAQRLPQNAAEQIEGLEEHLYAAARTPWDGAGLRAALAELDVAKRPGAARAEPLQPLYR
jgi:hypothetical protein